MRNWSAVAKTLWDEDSRNGLELRVLLTGSSATLTQEGLDESLNGRFELIHCPHWSFGEWREGRDEVDFVIAAEDLVTAIEVKSGRVKPTTGMARFVLENPHARTIVVGSPECGVESFLLGEVSLFAE